MTEDYMIELTSPVANLRHDMHRCDIAYSEYCQLLELFNCEIKKVEKETKIKCETISINQECWCNDDDCSMEYCPKCEELEKEEIINVYDKNNDIIENFLSQIDEKYSTETCPSGMARIAWAERQ